MSEGMTDEAFHAEIDELDKQGRYALAMVRATREADRARASETEKAAEIERLKAELATAQHEVAQMDAALRVTVPEIEARISSTCVWCGTAAPDPTSTEAMRAYVAEHVKVCANHPMRALEAELARLTPSGQVAEDERAIRSDLCDCNPAIEECGRCRDGRDLRPVLARLAAKAQGYEAMKAERDAMEERCKAEISKAITAESERDALDAQLSRALTEKTDIADRCFKAERERDAAIARAEEAEKQARLAWERHAEKDRAYGDAISQRDAAVADNAALAKQFNEFAPYLAAHGFDLRGTALTQPHPGTSLLKEREEREEVVKALAEALKTSREWVQNPTTRFLIEDALRRAQILP